MEARYKSEIVKLGARIKSIRKKKGMSQLDLELASGITRTEISRIENGLKNIEFYTLIKIATALEVELAQLFYTKAR